jgi:hypothetical protein
MFTIARRAGPVRVSVQVIDGWPDGPLIVEHDHHVDVVVSPRPSTAAVLFAVEYRTSPSARGPVRAALVRRGVLVSGADGEL